MTLDVQPVTPDRWSDLVALFGPNGAYSGCWCMWFRKTATEFSRDAGTGNRAAMRKLVRAGRVPGLIGYDGADPVGWVSLAPRAEFGRIERSRILQPVDDRPVWSIVCFFVHRNRRRERAACDLLGGAIRYARSQDVATLEAYPIDVGATDRKMASAELYVGTRDLFAAAGFKEVARHSRTRPVMRLDLARKTRVR